MRLLGLPRSLSLLAAVTLVTVVAAPRAARAQLGVGGQLGAELDNKNNWFLWGIEGRLGLKSWPGLDFQGRYNLHSYGSGVSANQLDANVLKNWDLARPGSFLPYVGVGGALVMFKGGGETENKVGLNLISGTRYIWDPTSHVVPFMHAQYTIVREYPNSFTLSFGALYTFPNFGK